MVVSEVFCMQFVCMPKVKRVTLQDCHHELLTLLLTNRVFITPHDSHSFFRAAATVLGLTLISLAIALLLRSLPGPGRYSFANPGNA